ncbi:MAG: hypothetical protein RLZZ370_1472 [Bacteroidota bacterium]
MPETLFFCSLKNMHIWSLKSCGNLLRLLMLLMLLANTHLAKAQERIIRGRVIAAETREPLSYALVVLGDYKEVVRTDFEGYYQLRTLKYADTLWCSYTGYEQLSLRIPDSSLNLELNFELKRREVLDRELVIRVKGNPAERIIKKAAEFRDRNDPDKLDQWECESFTRITIAVNNISEGLKKRKLGQQIGPLFDTISILSADSQKSVLPVFMSESLSDYYYNRNPKVWKEQIKATRVKGVGIQDGTLVAQVLGSSFVSYNFYQNTIVLLDKGLVSPISAASLAMYSVKIAEIDDSGPRKIYNIKIRPRNPKDLAFTGNIWIEDSSFALMRLALEVNNSSNLNYVEKFKITQEYEPTAAGAWINTKSRILVDVVEVNTKAAGLVATSTTTYRNIKVNQDRPMSFYAEKVGVSGQALHKPDSFWQEARHEPLTGVEQRVFNKIDTLVNLPIMRTYVDVVNFLVDGYVKKNGIGIGPYQYLVSYNPWEGFRNRIGFETNIHFSDKWLLKGFGAYGYKDQRFKYEFRATHIINRKKWTTLMAYRRADVDQIGITDVDFGSSMFTAFNLLTSNQLNFTTENVLKWGSDISRGLRMNVALRTRDYQFKPLGNYVFAYLRDVYDSSSAVNRFNTTTMTVDFRFAPRDYFLVNDNERIQVRTEGVVFYLNYTHGFRNVLGGEFTYDKIKASADYTQTWGLAGRTHLVAEYTQTFQTLPYPLLNVHVGNQSFVYSQRAYNQMNLFEFITDRSFAVAVDHHLGGLICNRLPLIRNLKWREVITAKAIYGTLAEGNRTLQPRTFNGMEVTPFTTFNNRDPYLELGYGIENILKFFRVDAVHRLTYRTAAGARNFGVKLSFGVNF